MPLLAARRMPAATALPRRARVAMASSSGLKVWKSAIRKLVWDTLEAEGVVWDPGPSTTASPTSIAPAAVVVESVSSLALPPVC